MKRTSVISLLMALTFAGAIFPETTDIDSKKDEIGVLGTIRTPTFEKESLATYVAKQGPVQLISLNFTNIKVRELLQIIAQFTKLNFVINDTVQGNMSIHLYRVPWTQALDVILKSQDLAERRIGNIVYISTVADIMKQQIDELAAKQRVRDLVALEDRVIHLKYANAEEILKVLDTKNFSLLSSRGTTNVDPRTNSIWIRDTPEHIKTITTMIRELDLPVKQVSIEARIVTIQRQNERAIGARLGLSRPSHLTGTLDGASNMANGTPLASLATTDRLNFDARANGDMFGSNGPPGSIGLAVAQLGSIFVDMELSALEQENLLNVLSSPRVITSNQQKAYIQTGEEIPYSSATSSGATAVSFANAVLKLEVTPQITPNNRVILLLHVSNDSRGQDIKLQGGGSAIAINTQEEESRVLLNDNQTVVLGGVYTMTKSHELRRIPFLGKLPVIGNLFKRRTKIKEDRELLIFITPHIIKKPSDMASA